MSDGRPPFSAILGALLFAARQPLSVEHIIKVVQQTSDDLGMDLTVTAKRVLTEIVQLNESLENCGVFVAEVGGGYRMQNQRDCGPWVRRLLEKGKTSRLSRPALETLAIVAYRQPCTRSEVEQVRGVAVDAIMRRLIELQLVCISGRSALPGRPQLFSTTRQFLEHFGMRSLNDLPAKRG